MLSASNLTFFFKHWHLDLIGAEKTEYIYPKICIAWVNLINFSSQVRAPFNLWALIYNIMSKNSTHPQWKFVWKYVELFHMSCLFYMCPWDHSLETNSNSSRNDRYNIGVLIFEDFLSRICWWCVYYSVQYLQMQHLFKEYC